MKIAGRWQGFVVVGLLALYVVLAVSASTQKSVTFDEIQHLTSGYLLWTKPAYHITPENGIAAQEWAALPLLLEPAKAPPESGGAYDALGQWGPSYRFFYAMGNDPARMLVQSRTMIALLGAALGALVFFWSRKLFGTGGALVSLVLFVFCPTMLANGAIVSADMAAALGFFAATFCFWRLSHALTLPRVLFSVLAVTGLVLSKMSAVLLAPIFALILLVRFFSARPVEIHLFTLRRNVSARAARIGIWILLFALHLAVVQEALWLFYNFTYYDIAASSGTLTNWTAHPESLSALTRAKVAALHLSAEWGLLPPAYLNGLSYILTLGDLRNGYFCGELSQTGWIWFFPVSFLVKTPVASLALFLVSFVALARWKTSAAGAGPGPEFARGPSLYDLSPLLILGGVYGVASITSHLNIGQRHIMPIYPVLFVLAGANVFWWRSGRPYRIAVALLLAGLVTESLAAWPNYISFFNQAVGGSRQGYHYFVDSSLDWGQDLPALRRWLDKNVPPEGGPPVYFSYFGTGEPRFYGIRAQLLPSFPTLNVSQDFPLRGGVYCISATMLPSLYSLFPQPWTAQNQHLFEFLGAEKDRWDATANDPAARARLVADKSQDYWDACIRVHGELRLTRLMTYLRNRAPDDTINGTILIYRLSDDDVRRALTQKLTE